MTQHVLPEDTLEDQRTLRRLGLVTGMFCVAATIMAVVIGVVMG